jgi:general secretion pathway protein L
VSDIRTKAAEGAANVLREFLQQYARLVRELAGTHEATGGLPIEARHDALTIGRDSARSVEMRDGHPDRAALAALIEPKDRAMPAELRLAPELVAAHCLELPTRDEARIRSIVANKIERIGPWPADQALYGMRIEADASTSQGSEVQIAIAGRDMVNDLITDLSSCGIDVSLVTAPVQQGAPVELLRQPTHYEAALGRRLSRVYILWTSLLAATTVVAAIAYALQSSNLTQLKSRMDGSQLASFEAGATGADTDQERDARALLARKRTAPSPLLLLKDITEALPDGAWLSTLSIADGTVTLGGTARDTAALIPALQATGILSDVALSGPITRADDAQASNFTITARLNEHAGDWP